MNYKTIQKKAYNAIKKNGTSAILYHSTGKKTYDKTTNTYTEDKDEYNGFVLVSTFKAEKINGENIKAGDVSLLCTFPARPVISDVIKTKSGKQYTAVFVEPVSPDDETDIMYTVQGR